MYKVKIDSKAEKQLARIDPRYQKAIKFSIDSLEENPLAGKKLDPPLVHLRSLRVGIYRILYEMFKKELIILVVSIAHRKEVYRRRQFPFKMQEDAFG